MKKENDIVVADRPSVLLRPIAAPRDIIAAHKEAVEIIKTVLVPGEDFGRIPNCGDKETLFKAGAERLCISFGLAISYEIVSSEADHDRTNRYQDKYNKEHTSVGLYSYVVRCVLTDRATGNRVADGMGVCSTLESKYISRPRDSQNTVAKMAEKRALTGVVLNALGLSDRFTADLEDVAANSAGAEPSEEALAEQKRADDMKAAGAFLVKEAKLAAADFAKFKQVHGSLEWPAKALAFKAAGVTDVAKLLEPSVIDAEFTPAPTEFPTYASFMQFMAGSTESAFKVVNDLATLLKRAPEDLLTEASSKGFAATPELFVRWAREQYPPMDITTHVSEPKERVAS